MTKLFEWLAVVGVLGTVWLSLVTNKIENKLTQQYSTLILVSPIIFLGLFGIYAATVVLYRVFTFNNCDKAAAELQEEVVQAKADLTRQGFQFKTHR